MRGLVLTVSLVALAGSVAAQVGTELAPRSLERSSQGELPFGPREPLAEGKSDQSSVLIDRLRVIELRGDGDDGAVARLGVSEVGDIRARGLTVELGTLGSALAPFLGKPLTEHGLDRLIESVLRHYEASDRPVTDVFAPRQSLAAGTLLLEIVEGRVGTIGFEIGDLFNDELLAGAVRLQSGASLRSSELQEHLDWFNRNPFRPVSLYAAPGAGEGEADLVFAFEERRPWRVYAGYENSGAEAAGEHRYFAGLNWGNAFGLDHLLNYQFTAGESLEELTAHAVSWEIPIHPWHHFARLTGGWAEISTRSRSAGLMVNSEGASWQLGGAYGLQLSRWNDFQAEFSLGMEFKSSENFQVFGGTEAFPGAVVEVLQFRADYLARRDFEKSSLAVQASLVASPGGLSGRNEDRDFAQFRAGAEARYLYGRARMTWSRQLPENWTLRASGEVQLASGALLPVEQIALGGHATVRGYDEREFLGDHGYLLSTELRTPAIEIPGGTSLAARLQFLGFLDHATVWREESGSGEEDVESLLSIGVGARAQAGQNLSVRADLGVPVEENGGTRGHIGVILSF